MACPLLAAISATVASIGLVLFPALVLRGSDQGWCAAMVASAGGIGAMIPAWAVMIDYALAAGVPVTALVLAGVVPGFVAALTRIACSNLQRRKARNIVPPVPRQRHHHGPA